MSGQKAILSYKTQALLPENPAKRCVAVLSNAHRALSHIVLYGRTLWFVYLWKRNSEVYLPFESLFGGTFLVPLNDEPTGPHFEPFWRPKGFIVTLYQIAVQNRCPPRTSATSALWWACNHLIYRYCLNTSRVFAAGVDWEPVAFEGLVDILHLDRLHRRLCKLLYKIPVNKPSE